MSLPAGAVKGLSDETGNAAFSASFFYVIEQLQVTATSPAVGSILAAPVTDLVVQFNKALRPLHDQHQRLPGQPGVGCQRGAAHVAVGRPDALRRHSGRTH